MSKTNSFRLLGARGLVSSKNKFQQRCSGAQVRLVGLFFFLAKQREIGAADLIDSAGSELREDPGAEAGGVDVAVERDAARLPQAL